jgi:hypothetical protein
MYKLIMHGYTNPFTFKTLGEAAYKLGQCQMLDAIHSNFCPETAWGLAKAGSLLFNVETFKDVYSFGEYVK